MTLAWEWKPMMNTWCSQTKTIKAPIASIIPSTTPMKKNAASRLLTGGYYHQRECGFAHGEGGAERGGAREAPPICLRRSAQNLFL